MQNESAKEFVNINEGSHLPAVNLLAHYYPDRPGSDANIQWDASIAASLPLFEGFTLVSKDRQAESAQRQAQLNLDLQRRQAASAIRTAYKTLSGDIAQIKALDRGFKLAYKAYQHLEEDYKNGLDTNEDVLIALTASWVAKQSLDAETFNARNDFEQLATLAGQRLDLYKPQD
jgi:outer membrane protein TolC